MPWKVTAASEIFPALSVDRIFSVASLVRSTTVTGSDACAPSAQLATEAVALVEEGRSASVSTPRSQLRVSVAVKRNELIVGVVYAITGASVSRNGSYRSESRE